MTQQVLEFVEFTRQIVYSILVAIRMTKFVSLLFQLGRDALDRRLSVIT